MKTLVFNKYQLGFFGLGFGLALFTVFGTTAYVITPDASEVKPQRAMSCQNASNFDVKDNMECKQTGEAETTGYIEQVAGH